jgi:transposase
VEGLGNLAAFVVTGGNVNDITQGPVLVNEVVTRADGQVGSVTADKGYDSAAFVAEIEAAGAKAVVPQLVTRKETRSVDWAHYKNRNLVERFFARLKQFRRIATRYDKLTARFTSFIHLAAAYIWLA